MLRFSGRFFPSAMTTLSLFNTTLATNGRRMFSLTARLILLGLLTVPVRDIAADEPAVATASAEIEQFGWHGLFQVGRWTPLVIRTDAELSQRIATWEVEAPDADGQRAIVSYRAESVRLSDDESGGGRPRYALRVRSGRLTPSIAIRGLAEDGTVLVRLVRSVRQSSQKSQSSSNVRSQPGPEQAVRLDTRMIALLGLPASSLIASQSAADANPADVDSPMSVCEFASTESFPEDPEGWDSLDAVVLSGRFDLNDRQSSALRTWVLRGGHLVVACSPASRTALESSRLASWLPIGFGKEVQLRELSAFETFVGGGSRIAAPGRVPALTLEDFSGVGLMSSFEGMLGGRVAFGFGRMTFLGLEPGAVPLSGWDTLPRFMRLLTSTDLQSGSESRERRSQQLQLTNNGVSDLATQLQYSQQQFSEWKPASVWKILGLILLYAILIGPFDYVLVHRIWKRPHATWFTFPVAILAVTVLTVQAGTHGSSVELNQIDLIDLDASHGVGVARSWGTLTGSRTQRATIALDSRIDEWRTTSNVAGEIAPPQIDWDGIPEEGFRGLYRQTGFDFVETGYRFGSDRDRVENYPLGERSTGSFVGTQRIAATSFCRSDLAASSLGTISGSIEHSLPGRLSSWMLVYRGRVYFPKTTAAHPEGIPLAPGQPIALTRGDLSQSRDLQGFLRGTYQTRIETGDVAKGDQIRTQERPYDSLETDSTSILRMISFYRAVDGRAYTGLRNFALGRLDWSSQLDAHHVVLAGVLESDSGDGAFAWSWNGTPIEPKRRTTFVRILLPVTLINDSRRELPELIPK